MAKFFAQTVFVLLAVALTFSKSSTFATPIKARHFLQSFKPVIFTNILDENTATTEAATTNLLEIEAANTAQTAAAFDHETAATTLIKKRHFLNGFKPVIFTNVLDENTATTEAATTNLLEIEAANTAQTAAAFDHETAATALLNKRHFLQGFKPVIFTNILDENTATTEAATTNLLEIEAANTAQTAAAFDHETAATALLNKRHFLQGFKPVIFTNILDENTATTEAATTNLLEIEAANTAQTAADFDHETAITAFVQL